MGGSMAGSLAAEAGGRKGEFQAARRERAPMAGGFAVRRLGLAGERIQAARRHLNGLPQDASATTA